MLKCGFKNILLCNLIEITQSEWLFPSKFATYFQSTYSSENLWRFAPVNGKGICKVYNCIYNKLFFNCKVKNCPIFLNFLVSKKFAETIKFTDLFISDGVFFENNAHLKVAIYFYKNCIVDPEIS